jgi:hypothetical protein
MAINTYRKIQNWSLYQATKDVCILW